MALERWVGGIVAPLDISVVKSHPVRANHIRALFTNSSKSC